MLIGFLFNKTSEMLLYKYNVINNDHMKITIKLSPKRKQELMVLAHQKGLVLNDYINLLLLNKIP